MVLAGVDDLLETQGSCEHDGNIMAFVLYVLYTDAFEHKSDRDILFYCAVLKFAWTCYNVESSC